MDPPLKWKAIMLKILKRLMSHEYAADFNEPVDAEGLGIPHYYMVIQVSSLGEEETNLLVGGWGGRGAVDPRPSMGQKSNPTLT